MRRLLPRVLVVIALAAFVGLSPNSASAAIYARTCYSTGYACDHTGYSGQTTWGFVGPHNCTAYAAWRLARNGVPPPRYRLGNAATWAAQAKRHGEPVDRTPAVGAIAQWNAGTAHARSQFGHVGYVQEVGPGYIVVVSDNFPLTVAGHMDTYRIPVGHSHWPSNFIHFKGVPNSPPPHRQPPSFTGDGKADIAWYEQWQNAITVLTSTGNSFAPAWKQSGIGGPDWAGVGDFTGDGKADIAWYERWQNAITVLSSTGNGFTLGKWQTGIGAPTWAGAG